MKKNKKKYLGVNIDHVATLRQARGGTDPSIAVAAKQAALGGADGITAHLREDRRHIQDNDLRVIQKSVKLPLNLEMALDERIVKIALRLRPEKVCIVPEKRRELTTEGGLNAVKKLRTLQKVTARLQKKNIEVSLFIDPDSEQVLASHRAGADAVELHTGAYAHANGAQKKKELARIRRAARLGCQLGLIVNAGHGLDYENVKAIAAIPELSELNIGHAIVSEAVFVGLKQAVSRMKQKV